MMIGDALQDSVRPVESLGEHHPGHGMVQHQAREADARVCPLPNGPRVAKRPPDDKGEGGGRGAPSAALSGLCHELGELLRARRLAPLVQQDHEVGGGQVLEHALALGPRRRAVVVLGPLRVDGQPDLLDPGVAPGLVEPLRDQGVVEGAGPADVEDLDGAWDEGSAGRRGRGRGRGRRW